METTHARTRPETRTRPLTKGLGVRAARLRPKRSRARLQQWQYAVGARRLILLDKGVFFLIDSSLQAFKRPKTRTRSRPPAGVTIYPQKAR